MVFESFEAAYPGYGSPDYAAYMQQMSAAGEISGCWVDSQG